MLMPASAAAAEMIIFLMLLPPLIAFSPCRYAAIIFCQRLRCLYMLMRYYADADADIDADMMLMIMPRADERHIDADDITPPITALPLRQDAAA